MTKNSIEYTINQLFKIANPKGNIKYDININEDNRKVIISIKESDKKIIFNLVEDKAWYDLIEEKCEELNWIGNSRDTYKIPVLFWENKELPFVNIKSDEIIFNGDIISSSFFMLSRWEEKLANESDVHGRFRFADSVACKYNFITIPVVDEYGMLLRKYLKILLPNIDLGENEFRIKLSHDIDDIRRFESVKTAIRTLGGDLIKRKSINLFNKSLKEWKESSKCPEKDPYFLGVYELANISKQYNMDSAFYFKTSDKSDHDSGYIIEDYVKKCISCLQNEGFEVGFHAGYYTYKNYDNFMKEKERLDKVLGYTSYGGRQHYLRFDVNTTWKYWGQAGLKYDSTVGYAEHEGFRCGTCHPFKPFDIDEDIKLDVIEIPLIVMDGTLQSYRNLTPEEGMNFIMDLINKCGEVEGVFTLLWHNTSIYRGWEDWFEGVYKKTLNLINSNYLNR